MAGPQRHHWLNTIVGILDAAFRLTPEEQYFTIEIVNRLLQSLAIPERSQPTELPPALALEMSSAFYTVGLTSARDAGYVRPRRAVIDTDLVVSLEAWRQAFMSMFVTAYPDLEPMELIVADKVLNDLLTALGIPGRVAAFFPEDVVRAHLEGA